MTDIIKLTKENKTYRLTYSGGVKFIQNKLEPDEEVLFAMMSDATLDDNFTGQYSLKNNFAGTTVLTNKRLIFCFKMIGPETYREVLIPDIISIDYGRGEFTNRLETISCEEFTLYLTHKDDIISKLHELLTGLRKPYVDQKRLDALKERFENGSIDEEEYLERKDQILGIDKEEKED